MTPEPQDAPGLGKMLLTAANQATGTQGFLDIIGLLQAAAKMAPSGELPELETGPSNSLVFKHPAFNESAEAFGASFMGAPSDMQESEREATLGHEARHLDQAKVLGPAMVAAKPLEAMMEYGSGPLERDAYRHEQPTNEFATQPAGGYSRIVEALLRGVLGQ